MNSALPFRAEMGRMSFGDGKDRNRRTVYDAEGREVCVFNPHMAEWTERDDANLRLMLDAVRFARRDWL